MSTCFISPQIEQAVRQYAYSEYLRVSTCIIIPILFDSGDFIEIQPFKSIVVVAHASTPADPKALQVSGGGYVRRWTLQDWCIAHPESADEAQRAHGRVIQFVRQHLSSRLKES